MKLVSRAAGPDQTMLNFARFSSENRQSGQEGFLW
jgi:hypothetical protein